MAGFMALPPDINAAMIEGPGEGSLMAAGAAMQAVGGALAGASAAVTAAVTTLAAAGWTGPSGVTTAAAFTPSIAWMGKTAGECMAIGVKHQLFAEAYRTANVMIPKVPVVAENQVEHMTLQATNIFGVNTIPIATNRTSYAGMWTAAGTAMDTYQAVGQAESTPIPVDPPPPITTSTGVEAATMAASMGLQIGGGLASGAMSAATTGLSAFSGVAGGAGSVASAVAPAAAQAAAPGTAAAPGGGAAPPGTPPAAKAGDEQQLTSLLTQFPQAASSGLEGLSSAPTSAMGSATQPAQALMGPLQSLMTNGGSGLGSGGIPTTPGMGGLGGMYGPTNMANDGGGRSTPRSSGMMRLAGAGGGYAMPTGWRSTADTLGFSTSPAAAGASSGGRAVAGGANLATGGSNGLAGGPAGTGGGMFGPMAGQRSRRTNTFRDGQSLSWEEDPFGAEEDTELPMALTERGP